MARSQILRRITFESIFYTEIFDYFSSQISFHALLSYRESNRSTNKSYSFLFYKSTDAACSYCFRFCFFDKIFSRTANSFSSELTDYFTLGINQIDLLKKIHCFEMSLNRYFLFAFFRWGRFHSSFIDAKNIRNWKNFNGQTRMIAVPQIVNNFRRQQIWRFTN